MEVLLPQPWWPKMRALKSSMNPPPLRKRSTRAQRRGAKWITVGTTYADPCSQSPKALMIFVDSLYLLPTLCKPTFRDHVTKRLLPWTNARRLTHTPSAYDLWSGELAHCIDYNLTSDSILIFWSAGTSLCEMYQAEHRAFVPWRAQRSKQTLEVRHRPCFGEYCTFNQTGGAPSESIGSSFRPATSGTSIATRYTNGNGSPRSAPDHSRWCFRFFASKLEFCSSGPRVRREQSVVWARLLGFADPKHIWPCVQS